MMSDVITRFRLFGRRRRHRRRRLLFFFRHSFITIHSVVASSLPQGPFVLQLFFFLVVLLDDCTNGLGPGAGVGLVDLHLGHADGPLEGRGGGEVRERGRRERNLEGLRVLKGGVSVIGVQLRVLNLARGEVAEGGAGVLEAGGVGGVGGGEGVAGGDGVLHEALALLASRHCFLVLDLGLVATHL